MFEVLWLVTSLIPGGARQIILWSLEIINKVAQVDKEFPVNISLASGPGGEDEDIQKTISTLNIPFYKIPHLKRSIDPFCDFVALREIKNLIKKRRFHIVHTHTSKAGFLGRLAAKVAGIKIVVHTPHGHVFNDFFQAPFSKLKSYLALMLEIQASKWCDVIIALSTKEENKYKQFGFQPRKFLATIPNGLPSNLIPATILETNKYSQTIGFLGRLTHEKGIMDLIVAFKEVITNLSDARLLIAGDGPLKTSLVSQVEKLGLSSKVTFLGYQTELSKFWDEIALLVLPSRSEGFGLALLEGMAHRKCIVAAKTGGIPEVVADGITGYIVPSVSPVVLAETIIKLLKDPLLLKKTGEAGFNHLKEHFLLEPKVYQLISLYKELLSKV